MAKKKRGAPTKQCKKCGATNHARRIACSKCGAKFSMKKAVTVKKKAVRRKKKKVVVAATVKKVVKRRKKRRGRPVGRPAAAASGGGGSFSLSNISAAKKLVAQLGGTSKTKKLLDVLG